MKVLVVDDSKVIRMLVAESITNLGHEIIQVENGHDGIDYIKENDIDLVLMDVEMPGLNGFDTTKIIREMCGVEWFPIIFLTTKQDDDSYTQGITSGGDAYLPKPINPLRLQLTITAMERIYLMRTQLKNAQKDLLNANQKLETLALTDELTRLPNRRNFDEYLDQQYKLARRNKMSMCLIICDIDFFKIYNDTYGHQAGDYCLSKVARELDDSIHRPTDKVCRYGGEEFTVVLPGTDLQGGLFIAEKLRAAVYSLNIEHKGSDIASWVTLSLGLAIYRGQYNDEAAFLRSADDALYRAKEQGRNRVEYN